MAKIYLFPTGTLLADLNNQEIKETKNVTDKKRKNEAKRKPHASRIKNK